jgi:ABC-type transport system involved in multi-copper enzyme maturation permease subunit
MENPSWRSRLGLPLLAKELLEQSARRRTYIVRAVYACLSFAAAWLLFYDLLRMAGANPQTLLGSGRQMFATLMKLKFAGIYLIMPAVTCGVVAHEKEHNTLALLFLTKLGPWTILFEKLFSRLVPMCCFLMMSLPLLAYAYSLGGITREHLWSGMWMLFITVLQIGSLSLLCSAWFRTTAGALVGAYAATALLIFGPLIVCIPLSLFFESAKLSNLMNSGVVQVLQDWQIIQHSDEVLMPFFAPMHFFDYGYDATRNAWNLGYFIGAARSWPSLVAGSLPILLSTVVFLVLSRICLVRRAFAAPNQRLLGAFRKLDGLFTRLNESRLTKGIVLIRDKTTFPDADPVAWRETTKRSLGRARYLIRIGLAVEGALMSLLIFLVIFTDGSPGMALTVLVFFMWGLAVMTIAVLSASLIAGERSHQTLDVLCTTPMAGGEIVLQKFRGVRRVMFLLWIPMLTVIVPQATGPSGLVCSLLSLAIYLPLTAWLSLYIGLKVKTRVRAIVASLAVLCGWCLLPLILVFLPLMMLVPAGGSSGPLELSILLSPAMMVAVNEYGGWRAFGGDPWPAMMLNFLLYGTVLVMIRRRCLVHADRLLGRSESCDRAGRITPTGYEHTAVLESA